MGAFMVMMRCLRRSAFEGTLRGLSTGSLQLASIKRLRDVSGAPLGDVKKALEETQYDFDQAYDALRRKGLAAAAKKASRVATEGLVGVAASDQRAVLVEVNCETDFVARNEKFCAFVHSAAESILAQLPSTGTGLLPPEAFLRAKLATTQATVEDGANALSGAIREKIHVRRAVGVATPGRLFTYCHNAPPGEFNGLGKIACVAAIEAPNGEPLSDEALRVLTEHPLGRQIAMHIAGMKPLYLDAAAVDPDHLAKERALLLEQASAAGKPESIVEKIVDGRLRKFYEEFCLMNQRFVLDEETTVEKLLKKFAKDHRLTQPLTIAAFHRLECGEGAQTT